MFRFSIRELMLVTLVVAMGVGWWLDRNRLAFSLQIWEQRAEVAKGYVETWVGDDVPWGTNWPLPNYTPSRDP